VKQENAALHLLLSQARALRRNLARRNFYVPPALENLIQSLSVSWDRSAKLYRLSYRGGSDVQIAVPQAAFSFYRSQSTGGYSTERDWLLTKNAARAQSAILELLEKDGVRFPPGNFFDPLQEPDSPSLRYDLVFLLVLGFLELAVLRSPLKPVSLLAPIIFLLLRLLSLRTLSAGVGAVLVLFLLPKEDATGIPFLLGGLAGWSLCLTCDRSGWPWGLTLVSSVALGLLSSVSGKALLLDEVFLVLFAGLCFLEPSKLSVPRGAVVMLGVIAISSLPLSHLVPFQTMAGDVPIWKPLIVLVPLFGISLTYWFAGTHSNPTQILTPFFIFTLSSLLLANDKRAFDECWGVLGILLFAFVLVFSMRLGMIRWKQLET
jgi:hypothetical protein